jgi:hypothetical protein
MWASMRRISCCSSAAAIPKNWCHPASHALIGAMALSRVPPHVLGVS